MVKEAEILKEFLKMVGATGTKEILEFLDENKEGRYRDFLQFVSCHMLNIRLRQLLEFDLIKYHVTRSVRKREWYTITNKGKEIVRHLREMEETIREHLHERNFSKEIHC